MEDKMSAAPQKTAVPSRRQRTGGRSARVVEAVLNAACAEFAEAGYARMRMEAIAARAGVNKTTLYRRWPTKGQLLRQALEPRRDGELKLHDTGSIREDLIEALRQTANGLNSAEGRALLLMFQQEGADPDVMAISQSVEERLESAAAEFVRRAIQRGELPPGTDGQLILTMLTMTLVHRIIVKRQSARADFLARLVDLVLDGARGDARRAGQKR
jgi:AcrR family transcriptional regulator